MQPSESIKTYERLRQGEIKTFPPTFFSKHARKRRITEIVTYLVEDILQITPENAYDTLTKKDFKAHKLTKLFAYVDDFPEKNDQREVQWLLRFTYPHLPEESFEELVASMYKEVLDGKRRSFPQNYFHGSIGEDRAIICTKYLVETILRLSPKEAPNVITREVLTKYRLKILLNLYFDSPFHLLTTTYPELSPEDFEE